MHSLIFIFQLPHQSLNKEKGSIFSSFLPSFLLIDELWSYDWFLAHTNRPTFTAASLTPKLIMKHFTCQQRRIFIIIRPYQPAWAPSLCGFLLAIINTWQLYRKSLEAEHSSRDEQRDRSNPRSAPHPSTNQNPNDAQSAATSGKTRERRLPREGIHSRFREKRHSELLVDWNASVLVHKIVTYDSDSDFADPYRPTLELEYSEAVFWNLWKALKNPKTQKIFFGSTSTSASNRQINDFHLMTDTQRSALYQWQLGSISSGTYWVT